MRYDELYVDHNTVNAIRGIIAKDNSPENMQELQEWYKQALFCAYCTEDYTIYSREMRILA